MIKTPIKSSPRLPLKLHKDLQEGDKKKDKKNVKTKKKKKSSRSKSKNSFHQQIIHSVHKKLEKNKKLKKKMNTKEKLCFNKMQIIESKEFKELCMLESEYRKSIKQISLVKWLVPKEALSKSSCLKFSEFLKEKDFQDLNNLMMNFLHFVCKRRIIKDQDFQNIYNELLMKFPHHKNEVKQIMIQVLKVLDS